MPKNMKTTIEVLLAAVKVGSPARGPTADLKVHRVRRIPLVLCMSCLTACIASTSLAKELDFPGPEGSLKQLADNQNADGTEYLDITISIIPNSSNEVLSISVDLGSGIADFSFGTGDTVHKERHMLSVYEQGAAYRITRMLPKYDKVSVVPLQNDYSAVVTYRGATNAISRSLSLPTRLQDPFDGFVCIGDDGSKDAYYSILRLYRLLLPRINAILRTHLRKRLV